jgi:hypothetical protein
MEFRKSFTYLFSSVSDLKKVEDYVIFQRPGGMQDILHWKDLVHHVLRIFTENMSD